jgi:hypothetical protein
MDDKTLNLWRQIESCRRGRKKPQLPGSRPQANGSGQG